ncbi:MAG TPA: hypothetical protein PKA06_06295 [Gemmatales bacterium]|nr:hypothetical protein [Gemmatales bacterium]HMP16254.1 hypothetical protein [Gemmatales bacterium]
METVLERLSQPSILVPFFIFGFPVLIWGIKTSITGAAKARAIEAEINLKRELAAQGRSAEEIERIINCRNQIGKLDE